MKSSVLRAKLFLFALAFLFTSIQTPPAQAQSDKITFAVIGDYGLAGQNEADVANLVKSWNPDFIVTAGDNNYQDGAAWSIDDNIGQYYHDYIFPYTGKYGNGSATRRFFPALGNHDWGANGAKPYFNYFGYYKQQTFYDFVQGPVHFFVLDSDKNEPEGVASTSAQAKWLKKSLAASTSTFNIIILHHPPYSSGRHGSNVYMQWPFKDWGADAVIAGHDHTYERLLVNGIPFFVNGIGGAELYKFENTLPESQVRFNLDFGAMRVEATSASMKFQTITRAGVLVDEYTIGQSNPSITAISLASPSPTNAGVLNFQVTISEAVTGVDVSDFTLSTNLSGTAIGNLSGAGNSYTVSVNSGNGDGTLRLDLADNDSITNGMGNPLGGFGPGNGNFTNGQTFTVDKSAPKIISITRASSNPTNATSVDFSVTFSEPVTGVDVSDFALSTNAGASLSNISGTGSAYLLTAAAGIGDDILRLDFMDNDSVIDSAGNSVRENFSSGESYTMDRSAPFVTSIVRANQTNAIGVEYTVSFSEAVLGVDGGDFLLSTLNGAAITNVFGAGNIYTVSISTNFGSDTIKLDLIDNDSIFDNAGNVLDGNYTNGEIVVINQSAPIVTSIMRASPNPTNAASVDFIVTFSEPVEGVDGTDFVVTGGAGILNINNVNPFYIVTLGTSSNDGALKLDLVDDDSIHNAQGITLGGDGVGNANYTNGETFSIDRTPPRVTSIVRASGNPTIHPSVDFIVTFSEPVVGTDATDFVVTTSNLNSFITNFQNANPFFAVSVNSGAGSGTLRLDLIDNLSVTDLAGNNLNNGNGIGSFTNGEFFTLAKIPVNFTAPNILNSTRNALTNNPRPNFSWSSVRGARAYELFIARDAGFTQIVLMQTVNATDFTLASALADGIYFAQVRAYNADLNPGKFSKPYTFTIDTTPPPPPTLVSPPNSSTSLNRPTLQWLSVGGDTQYQIQLDNNADFSSPEVSESTNKTSLRTRPLARNTIYYWQIRAKDKAGNWSGWSGRWYVKSCVKFLRDWQGLQG
ncbi:MAG: metallophosphoesterase [Chloroflexi bacterium]|nr:metallophosphoesterase [Chloroflexota bacterium]